MKIALYQKTRYGKFYVSDFKSNIEYTTTNALHLATVFDTEKNKDDIFYMTKTFGHDFKIEKVTDFNVTKSQELNRVYI